MLIKGEKMTAGPIIAKKSRAELLARSFRRPLPLLRKGVNFP
jgi:hypothetical protein